ncbi:MAG: hypothetical protein Q8P02_04220, partial [Candidatus Micrarchaeota archaeon]|nr:hypothetical protein [Candidatus Micrarchaeota archaeon]
MQSLVYHLTPRVPGRAEIHVIGFEHGLLQMSRAASEYLLRHQRENPHHRILTEGLRGTPLDKTVPFKMLRKARAIESPLTRLLLVGSVLASLKTLGPKRVKEGLVQAVRNERQEHSGPGQPVESKPPDIRWQRNALEKMTEVPRIKPHVRFQINVRSLLLASETLKQTRTGKEKNRPVSLVVGALHARQLNQFLENPRLARRYISAIRGRLAKGVPKIMEKQLHGMLN